MSSHLDYGNHLATTVPACIHPSLSCKQQPKCFFPNSILSCQPTIVSISAFHVCQSPLNSIARRLWPWVIWSLPTSCFSPQPSALHSPHIPITQIYSQVLSRTGTLGPMSLSMCTHISQKCPSPCSWPATPMHPLWVPQTSTRQSWCSLSQLLWCLLTLCGLCLFPSIYFEFLESRNCVSFVSVSHLEWDPEQRAEGRAISVKL